MEDTGGRWKIEMIFCRNLLEVYAGDCRMIIKWKKSEVKRILVLGNAPHGPMGEVTPQ